MRFLVTAKFPVEAGNKLISSGQIGPKLEQIMTDLRPEAAYFATKDGCRCMYLVINIDDASELPAKLEPIFLTTNSEVNCELAMTVDDLKKGMGTMEAVVKKYGS